MPDLRKSSIAADATHAGRAPALGRAFAG